MIHKSWPLLALLAVVAVSGCEDDPEPYCPVNFKMCEDTCINVQVDSNNCGDCNAKCQVGETCSAGACAAGCGGGAVECSGKCADLKTDPKNCGKCGTGCKAGEVCSIGLCAASCLGSTTNCSGKCVDTKLDPKNCGACGTGCKAGEVCSAGKCGTSCLAGTTNCSGTCVDALLDPQNCGSCGTKCKATEVCSAGKCGVSCVGGTTNCSKICVDTQLDPGNCGTCDNLCKTGEVCSLGKCGVTCVGGATKCNSKCVDIKLDPANCGTCGNICKAGEVCSAGKCGLSCVGGTSECAGKCVDTQTSPLHCGACGTICPGKCAAGKCLCGDGAIQTGEWCDGQALGGKTCASNGFSLGALACKKDCTLDTAGCSWAVRYGGNKSDVDEAVIGVDAKGNSFVVAEFTGTIPFGTTTVISKGDQDIFVGKLDADGKPLWAVSAGSAKQDQGDAVAVDLQGNAYVLGNYRQSVDFGGKLLIVQTPLKQTSFVWKLSSTGVTVWASSVQGSQDNEGTAIAADSAGNSYIVGHFVGKARYGNAVINSAGSTDGYVAKLDKNGNFLWALRLGGTGADMAESVAVDSTGNVIVSGQFTGKATFGQTVSASASGNTDAFVMKLDSAGKVLWVRAGGSLDYDDAEGVGVDGAGYIYVTGEIEGTATFGGTKLTVAGDQDVYVWKLDTDGKHVWAVQGKADASASSKAIAVDATGNSYICGYQTGKTTFGATNLPQMDDQDVFVAKLDNTGKWQWARAGSSPQDANCFGLAVGPNNRVHASGAFEQYLTLGAKTLVSAKHYSGREDEDLFVWTLPTK